MGLEVATYISNLVTSNPLGTDDRSKGDDHLRLIKSVLQATFPNANRAFYFPTPEEITADETGASSDQNRQYFVDASGGDVTVTLPDSLASSQLGFSIDIQKTDSSANSVVIEPASGTINGVANISLGQQFAWVRAIWTGSAWRAFRADPTAIPDATIDLDMLTDEVKQRLVFAGALMWDGGDTVPDGYLYAFGQNVSRTTYPDLFARYGTRFGAGDGSTTFGLPNIRGRLIVCRDDLGGTAANNLQVSTNITTTSGSVAATVSSATGLAVGMKIVSANVAAGTTISAINGTSVTLSAVATGTGGPTAARFSWVTDANVVGSVGGFLSHILTLLQMPLHGHPWRRSDVAESDPQTSTNGAIVLKNSANEVNEAAYTGTPSGTAGRQIGGSGGDQPHPNLPPVIVLNAVIKAH